MKYEVSKNLYDIYDLKCILEEIEKGNLSQNWITAIKNAWIKGSFLDNRGIVWISREYLHTLLRVNKRLVNYYLAQINRSNDDFISGKDFIILISDIFENATTFKRRDYIRYSENLYRLIRDSPKAEVLRARYQENIGERKNRLKEERLSKYPTSIDELTGEALISNTAEFSHIRSVALHSDLQLEIENGLIVNKETHEIITKENVQNEDDLYSLCIKNNWHINWYHYYKNWYNKLSKI